MTNSLSRSPRDKGKGDTPRASPAAVCLIASMLASVSEACVACPSVVFHPRVDITKVTAQGDLWPLTHQPRRYKRTYPLGHSFSFDPEDTSDAALAAKMLAGAVQGELTGVRAECAFKCDTDFGCDFCIPKGIVAAPAQSEDLVSDALVESIDWIADTGSAQDLLTDRNLPDRFGYYSDSPIRLITANGESSSTKQGKVEVPELKEIVKPYLVESSPAVLSVGTRRVDKGYDFIWKGSKGESPYFITPGGKKVALEVRDYVPYLCSGKSNVSVPAVDESEIPLPDEVIDGEYSPSIAPGEGNDDDNDPQGINVDNPEDLVPEIIGDPYEEQEYLKAAETDAVESADRKAMPEQPSDGPVDPEFIRKRDKGVSALKEEAKSIAHQMNHIPKNPYCDVCNKAKMLKPPGRSVGGSQQIDSDKFGQHITADFLVTMSEAELGIDSDRVALVVKDVATDFRYVYPSSRRAARDVILALKHFIRQEDTVEVFYSDNAPELVSAAKVLVWKHIIGRDYISTSNSVAERAVRSSLEGTRANLIQSGLHHSYWPYAARHWCIAHNIIEDEKDELGSPWKRRFGENFPGLPLPFGCRVDYWNGPKKRPKNNLRFEPTTDPGIFLGYAIHPEFNWRKEYLVISLKDALDSPIDAKLKVLRVININKPSSISFPLQNRMLSVRDGRLAVGLDEDEARELSDQDAKPVREPEPSERSMPEIEKGLPVQESSASAIHHPGWLGFLRHFPDKEGWYEFAECKVRLEAATNKCSGLPEGSNSIDYPFRTICFRSGESWHVREENLKIDPPDEILEKEIDFCEVLASIFSREPLNLRERVGDVSGVPSDVDEVEVINPITGAIEKIKRDDPTFYNASGFKARRYKGSSKPMDIPPFVWKEMSTKDRRKAIAEEQKKIAKMSAEPRASASAKAAVVESIKADCKLPPAEDAPSMPIMNNPNVKHRRKVDYYHMTNSLVARPVNKKEIKSNPKAQEALDLEWNKLVKKTAWLYDTVSEWYDIS